MDNRKSLTGFIFIVFGGPVSWKSNLQFVVALSTTEVEYIVMTEAIKESIWLRGLSHELSLYSGVITVYYGNQSTIYLDKNHVYHERWKHIDPKFHLVKDMISLGEVKLEKVSIEENHFDMLTKALPIVKFKNCPTLSII